MSWPFGGLPLGRRLPRAGGRPLVQLARLGGPLLLTAGVWAGGVGPGHGGDVDGVHGGTAGRPSAAWRSSSTGLVALVVRRCRRARRRRARCGRCAVALVQGGGAARPQQGTGLTDVGLRRPSWPPRRGSPRPGPAPELVVWPEDVVALDRPLAGSPQAARAVTPGAAAPHARCSSASPSRRRRRPSATRSWPGARGPGRRHVREGAPGPLRRVRAAPLLLRTLRRPVRRSHRRRPRARQGLMRTPAGPLGLLVSFEIFYAGRSHASVRAGAELLVVPTNTSSYSTSQVPAQEIAAGAGPGRPDGPRPRPGRADRIQRRGHPTRRRGAAQRPRRAARSCSATVALRRGFTPYDHWGDLPVLVLALVALVAGWPVSGGHACRHAVRKPPIRTCVAYS